MFFCSLGLSVWHKVFFGNTFSEPSFTTATLMLTKAKLKQFQEIKTELK